VAVSFGLSTATWDKQTRGGVRALSSYGRRSSRRHDLRSSTTPRRVRSAPSRFAVGAMMAGLAALNGSAALDCLPRLPRLTAALDCRTQLPHSIASLVLDCVTRACRLCCPAVVGTVGDGQVDGLPAGPAGVSSRLLRSNGPGARCGTSQAVPEGTAHLGVTARGAWLRGGIVM
jgi:hypothetical protein